MSRQLTAREKQLETLVHKIGEFSRKEGIWILPERIREKRDGKISFHMTIFPLKWIQEHDNNLPTKTILAIRQAGERLDAYKYYEIPEDELESIPFTKRDE